MPPLILACPRCRGLVDGRLVVAHLQADGEGLRCGNAACGAVYRRRDGIPVVFRDEPASVGDDEMARPLVAAYLHAWDTPGWPNAPRERLEALLTELSGGEAALDLCAGTARASGLLAGRFEHVVALDAYLPLLALGLATLPPSVRARVYPVCADALDPPFLAQSFDLVYLGAALDSVRAPLLLLGQADALLAPGGLLVAATPFAWSDAVTPVAERLDGPAELVAALRGDVPGLDYLDYDVVEERDGLAWKLRQNVRTETDFRVHWLVARKRPPNPLL